MAFVPKEWKDRLVEFAGRRKLTNVSTGEEMIVDVARNEGTVSQEGDAFSAANMSDLEQRVADEFNNINTNFVENIYVADDGKLHKLQGGADSVLNFNADVGIAFTWHNYSGGNHGYEYNTECTSYSVANYKNVTITILKDMDVLWTENAYYADGTTKLNGVTIDDSIMDTSFFTKSQIGIGFYTSVPRGILKLKAGDVITSTAYVAGINALACGLDNTKLTYVRV